MDEARAEALRNWADIDRKRRRENGETNPLVDAWVAAQVQPLCFQALGDFTCVPERRARGRLLHAARLDHSPAREEPTK